MSHRLLRPIAGGALAFLLLAACGGSDDPETEVLGVQFERTTSTAAGRPDSGTTSAEPAAETTTTTAAPATTTTAAPPPPAPAAPTTGTVEGAYSSPDGNGTIRVDLQRADGSVAASRALGPSGGPFAFESPAGVYRLQITDAGPVDQGDGTRTQSQVVTRTQSFTLEAGRSVRFECHISDGCTGVAA